MISEFISIHPDNPQPRLISKAAAILKNGGVGALPTDSAYALCCMIGDKGAMERIARIRGISRKHNFTLICSDLSALSTYAKVSNNVFRLLKRNTPGAYTFILPATKEVPRRLMNEKRKTIGMRVPRCAIINALLQEIGEPLLSCSLILPGDSEAQSDPVEINSHIGKLIDLIVDGGVLTSKPTTVIRFDDDDVPEIRRIGGGDPSPFTE